MSPQIKFENSPVDSIADSFVSSPGTQYPLFETRDPEVMTPRSYNEDSMFGGSMDGSSMAGTPAPEKKPPVKKRKSWGQQLPEPKTNLPPRKRAKTEDEKEQRRVERVLRNRRAAQSSRERKRQEVEALEAEKRAIERRNLDLEMRLADMEEKNMMLQRQLEQFTGGMTVFPGDNKSPSTAEAGQFRQSSSPVTLSRDLFNSKDQEERPSVPQQCFADPHSIQTVNPASLSPEIRPVVESNAGSSDMTQHPAAMLCDLQCQSEEHRPWTASTSISQLLATILFFNLTSTLLNPLYQIINSLRTGSSLSPTTSVLTSIIWVVTTTASLSNSTSMNSSTMTNQASPRPKFSLRIRSLNRLLACSPQLARPLMDATMAAMRLQSEQQFSRDGMTDAGALERCGDDSPSLEALMTLLWAIHIFEKKREGTPGPLPIESRELGELDGILRTRESGGLKGFPHLSLDQRTTGRKTLEGWRTVHDRP